jgi:hypothetical protein
MKSFELTDTLFTRYCKQEDLFGYIEQNYPYPEFRSKRLKSETIARERHDPVTLDHIYEVFKELTIEECPLDTYELLKAYELNLEVENSIPIQCNINLISEDDIFILDSYFTEEHLVELLRKHGIPEKKMYKFMDMELPETSVHIGKKNRPNLKESNDYAFTSTETLLYDSPLLKNIRSFRLKNPYTDTQESEYKYYHDQSSYALPILLLFCIHLKKLLVKENRTKVLFCTNGLYQLFSAMFPEMESLLFSTSSLIHLHPTHSYKEYVQKLYQDKTTMIVDLHGFFQRDGYIYKELFGNIPRVHLLVHELQCDFPSLSYCIESRDLSTEYIDSLSYDTRGVLFSMVEGIELRLHETKPKHSIDLLPSFSEQFTGLELDLMNLDIPPIILQIIESACLT